MAEADRAIRERAGLRRFAGWVGAFGFTYLAGKTAVELAKWVVLMYLAPGAEAKLILVGYLVWALLPVALAAIAAFFCWRLLIHGGQHGDAIAVLALELIFLAYVGYFDLLRALADFAPPA